MVKIQISTSLLFGYGAFAAIVRRDGSQPSLTTDPNTSKYCSWWVDYSVAQPCSNLLSDNSISLADFRRWNPSINANCDNLKTGNSYCVEASNEPRPSTSTTKVTTPSTLLTTSTSKPVTTTTKSSNGIATPTPTQPNMVDNCDKFYYVKSGDNCDSIANANGITVAQFLKWNPSSGSKCDDLWGEAYACVSIIGHEPSRTTTTTTSKSNGVATPTPTQSGMVSNCNKFHYVAEGEKCDAILKKYSISLAQFTKWNPAAKNDCSGLWAETYACVGLIGGNGTPTTSKGNGVTTPTPTQTGMTKNCKSFHYVVSGDTCATITSKYKITTTQFRNWNPAVGSDCKDMWAKTYACVAVL